MTKFERARRQTIESWENILWCTACNECRLARKCGFCYYYESYSPHKVGREACLACPVKEQCIEVVRINGGLGRVPPPLCMAVLLWLISDDCKSLDDGSM